MRKMLTLLLLVSALTATAQRITGTWKGVLHLGAQQLNLVFHFQPNESGTMGCTMDSPDQSAKGIATQLDLLTADSCSVRVPQLQITYNGKLRDGVIRGTFQQGPLSLSLDLKPGDVVYKRPQEPVMPLPYTTEEVTFRNEAAQATLVGTLTYPEHYQPGQQVPVVLLVSGSGLQDRDESCFGHRPFYVLADYLARHGIASLRYDDRGHGQSKGDVTHATTLDFAADARQGIAYLRQLGKFNQVGVLGHSEGANIAFMLGAQGQTDFVISLAGIGVKGVTALTAQVNKVMQLMGLPGQTTEAQYRANVEAQGNAWLSYFIDYDPVADIKATKCPVMAINGEKDVQVISSLNLEAMRPLLASGKQHVVKAYAELNHLFQHCTTGLTDEYSKIDETLSPEVLADLAQWINGLHTNP